MSKVMAGVGPQTHIAGQHRVDLLLFQRGPSQSVCIKYDVAEHARTVWDALTAVAVEQPVLAKDGQVIFDI